ncbi:MAG: penicillin-binding protein 2 [Endomicrobium sp.]|jgi:penicillin-binding protein 2|nr:penicillin-binding protein 2 [Endomicrobium sp.]
MVWQKENKFNYETFLEKHKVILVFFMLLFIGLSIRLFYLQIIKGDKYRKISQQQRMYNTRERAPRGIIYSADKEVLAENKFNYVVFYHPLKAHQNSLEQVIVELNKILDGKIKQIANKDLKYGKVVKLIDNLTVEEMFKIQEKKLNLKGVSVVREPRRVYFHPEAISHVIGYVNEIRSNEIENMASQGYKIGDYIGRGGIEQEYDKYLHGKDGGWQIEVNAKGYQIKAFKYVTPEVGADIYSTINLKLQKVAYDALKDSCTARGAIVVLDAKTGAVKALVSCPGFNANTVGSKKFDKYLKNGNSPLFNRTLQALYPPGSIFKVITFAAAADLLNINPSEITFTCTGSFEVGNRHFGCWYKPGHGNLNFIAAVAQSCSSYFYQLGLKLGIKNLEKYAKKFYLGQKTGIDLPNEKKGFIPNPEWKKAKLKMPWFRGDTAIFAIGQGAILVTPLQMACIMSAVANKGLRYKPYIVDKVVDFEGNEIYKHELKFDDKLELSDKTWTLLHQALLESVENGTGRRCKLEGIKIAGKTGTAQNSQGKDHAWFTSYAPADNPEIVIAVIVEHVGGGGLNAAPICKKIYEAYFNIEPTNEFNKEDDQ